MLTYSKKNAPLVLSLDTDKPRLFRKILGELAGELEYVKVSPAFHCTLQIPQNFPGYKYIYDGKLGDVPHTMAAYLNKYSRAFKNFTLDPYCGYHSLQEFLKNPAIFSFIWLYSSDTTASEWQKPLVDSLLKTDIIKFKNAGFVLPATDLKLLEKFREKFPEKLFLIPGIGTQSCYSLKEIIKAAGKENNFFVIGRSIINAESPLAALQNFKEEWFNA
jgi:orotidine-5'-phosphate decarboxylase